MNEKGRNSKEGKTYTTIHKLPPAAYIKLIYRITI